MAKSLLAAVVAGMLGACSTVSFAPPNVDLQHRMTSSKVAGCSKLTADGPVAIERNADGAMYLIDNFELAYRCAGASLADGRRYFEVPAFLLGVAGIVGPSLGLSSDGKLVAGAGSGVLTAGNSYFAPKAKAAVVSAAHSAVTCVQSESAGVDYFQRTEETQKKLAVAEVSLNREAAAVEANKVALSSQATAAWLQRIEASRQVLMAMKTQADIQGAIQITGEVQYFQMVSSALLSVQSILSDRLRDAGSTDTAGTFAQLTELAKKYEEAKAKVDDKKKNGAGSTEKGLANLGLRETETDLITLENKALHPKIQTCVLRARH